MKKILMLAITAFLFTGVAFAHGGGDKKKCAKGKECCKSDAKAKASCHKDEKETKATTTAKKVTTKKA